MRFTEKRFEWWDMIANVWASSPPLQIQHLAGNTHSRCSQISSARRKVTKLRFEDVIDEKRLKQSWHGHFTRCQKLCKGDLAEERRKGRQKKKWEGKIRKWTDLEFRDTLRGADNKDR
ncbi:hypothetical protein PoB_000505800 [Plakobranchus ocellatus]|uniref:Uncharacterized protein n=1 Tax=Plakobranchus ocellatus TaxID=259542 RepID=A0AAV3Y802_9GAST|nr:hypothetical protein PoB_000505800 [Plakobranchus ocellatus]